MMCCLPTRLLRTVGETSHSVILNNRYAHLYSALHVVQSMVGDVTPDLDLKEGGSEPISRYQRLRYCSQHKSPPDQKQRWRSVRYFTWHTGLNEVTKPAPETPHTLADFNAVSEATVSSRHCTNSPLESWQLHKSKKKNPFLWNLNVHQRIHKGHWVVPILYQQNSYQISGFLDTEDLGSGFLHNETQK